MIDDFHNIIFPQNIGFSATKSIERLTGVQDFLSGQEQRNAKKYHSKRKYEVAVAAKSFDDLATICDFFEARRGALIGFKWRDILDFKTADNADEINAFDQNIGVFDGGSLDFQLCKTYGSSTDDEQNYIRKITRPRADTLTLAIEGIVLNASQYIVDGTTGIVTILPAAGLALGDEVSAGFEFDVPVRFAGQDLKIDYKAFNAGEIAKIPLVEILE